MKRLVFAVALLIAAAPVAFAQEDTAPGGFLDRILHPAGKAGDAGLPDRPPLVVVLDPGHGGDDTGAKSPRQGLEKNVTLRLAGMIRQRLEKGKVIRVVMTREEDTPLTPVERLEKANASGALLLLSLHAAGGARPMERPLHLFVNDPQPPADARAAGEWRYLANRHDAANRQLAADLTGALRSFYGEPRAVKTIPTSRLFLGGANLPTVMAEVIDLAGPTGNSLADDDAALGRLADALAVPLRKAAAREASRVR